MKYQLVLQLPVSSVKDYDAMIQLEEAIMEDLGNLGNLDGHDAGSGEMNIFVLTDDPKGAFDRIRHLLYKGGFMPDLKAAFRLVGNDELSILHPPDLTNFVIV